MKTKFCPNCGHKNPNSAKFCANCGYHFTRRLTPTVNESQTHSLLTTYKNMSFFMKIITLIIIAISLFIIFGLLDDGYHYVTEGPAEYNRITNQETNESNRQSRMSDEKRNLIKLSGKSNVKGSNDVKSFMVSGNHIDALLSSNANQSDVENAWDNICEMNRELPYRKSYTFPLKFIQNGDVVGVGSTNSYHINWN